ncbi:MAG: hypothetical protein ACM3PE_12680 [Deltaproteobacteria bacterium]
MSQVTYKIFIPFHFGIGNKFYKTDLTISDFDIKDIHIKMHLDEFGDVEKSYLIVITNVEEDGVHDFEELADSKVGNAVQDFFNGISKGLSNAAFFNVYNGDEFVVGYEMYCNGRGTKTPFKDRNKGYYLDDGLVNKAIEFANSDNEYLKQAFLFLKEGEYLVDIGRFSNAVIQFAAMTEYLIDFQLRDRKMINDRGEYFKRFRTECKSKCESGRPSFSFSKYVYGLSQLGLTMEQVLVEAIQNIYDLRNKLAHGYNVFEAFKKCGIEYDNEPVTEFNIWDFMMAVIDHMTGVYNFFAENFK